MDHQPGPHQRHLCLCDPARVAARRDLGRLVRVMAVDPHHRPGADLHSLAVPDRPAALTPLAADCLAGAATAALMLLGALGPELDVDRDHAIANPIGVAWAE